jgi:hypothetical protein
VSDVPREFVAGFPAIILTISGLSARALVESQNNFLVAQKVLEAEFLVAQKIVLLDVLEAKSGSARRVDLVHAYLIFHQLSPRGRRRAIRK